METKDLANHFSLQDFLAYLFPGVASTAGIYTLLLLTPLNSTLVSIEIDLAVGVFLLILSYVIGILLSGLSRPILDVLYKLRKLDEPRDSIPIPEHCQAITTAYASIFNQDTTDEMEWSRHHFLLCRSLVNEYMPKAARVANRQNSLRLLREYLIVPVLIWFLVGVCCGILSLINGFAAWGIAAIAISVALASLVVSGLISKTHGNRRREVREVLMAFLIGYQQELFSTHKETGEKS